MLVAELVKEKDEAEKKRAEEIELARAPEGESLGDKLARERQERKQAALERSLQRQRESPNYFEARRRANEEYATKKDSKAGSTAEMSLIEEQPNQDA